MGQYSIPKPEPRLEPLGQCVAFRVRSASREGRFHYVVYSFDGGGIQCSCEGWQFNGNCKHVAAIPLCEFDTPQGFRCDLVKGHPDYMPHKSYRDLREDPFVGL